MLNCLLIYDKKYNNLNSLFINKKLNIYFVNLMNPTLIMNKKRQLELANVNNVLIDLNIDLFVIHVHDTSTPKVNKLINASC